MGVDKMSHILMSHQNVLGKETTQHRILRNTKSWKKRILMKRVAGKPKEESISRNKDFFFNQYWVLLMGQVYNDWEISIELKLRNS